MEQVLLVTSPGFSLIPGFSSVEIAVVEMLESIGSEVVFAQPTKIVVASAEAMVTVIALRMLSFNENIYLSSFGSLCAMLIITHFS